MGLCVTVAVLADILGIPWRQWGPGSSQASPFADYARISGVFRNGRDGPRGPIRFDKVAPSVFARG
jgi:hypothetical protein